MSTGNFVCRFLTAILVLVLAHSTLAAQTEKVLYDFTSDPNGVSPGAGLVMDKTGTLYGTTEFGGPQGGGTVFELTPPAGKGGSWTETAIYGFQGPNDGYLPSGTLLLDKSGNLYGTTAAGGLHGSGTVFELTPPASGVTWNETLLYTFGILTDAISPRGLTHEGNALYGTTVAGGTYGAGAVFKLTPPASGSGEWTESVLYSFTGGTDGGVPYAPPIVFGGALYGTTSSGGTGGEGVVYQLKPPARGSTAWTETVLHSFSSSGTDGANPWGSLVADAQGGLYGTTKDSFGPLQYGVVFKLSPPNWVETVLYTFTGAADGEYPESNLIFDSNGALYGTTAGADVMGQNMGSVFMLSPPSVTGGAWTETTLHAFTGGSDGGAPLDGLLLKDGILFGTTAEGGPPGSNGGLVFALKP